MTSERIAHWPRFIVLKRPWSLDPATHRNGLLTRYAKAYIFRQIIRRVIQVLRTTEKWHRANSNLNRQ